MKLSLLPPILFAVFFIGMWFYVSYRAARGGWTELVRRHPAPRSPYGRKWGAISGWFTGSSFQGSLVAWATPEGLYLRPILIFRSFHPTVLIPWSTVMAVSEEKKFLSKETVVELDVAEMAVLLHIPGSRTAELEQYVPRKS